MDELSQDLEKAELQAFRTQSHQSRDDGAARAHRSDSALSSVTSSTSSSASPEGSDMSRIQTAETQRGTGLERHPTALSRIATYRSQQTATVGSLGLKVRPSKRPLPEFGAGKPYPPPLPEKEEYVVEFVGPHDPLHPQNWSTARKYVILASPRVKEQLADLVRCVGWLPP